MLERIMSTNTVVKAIYSLAFVFFALVFLNGFPVLSMGFLDLPILITLFGLMLLIVSLVKRQNDDNHKTTGFIGLVIVVPLIIYILGTTMISSTFARTEMYRTMIGEVKKVYSLRMFLR